jgi:IclR family KDG regulon transcriptional repressor
MTMQDIDEELAPKYHIGVINKAFDLLDVLEAHGPLTLTELSVQSSTNKVTALRILANLEARGYVERDEAGRYSLGLRLLQLGLRKSAAIDLRTVAHPALQGLREQFDETANLGILDGTGILYIDILESTLGLRMAATVGARDDIHSTAIGKAIASTWDGNRAARIVTLKLQPKTPRTITDAALLERELDAVRERGYSIDDEENETGARCIGAPVLDHAGACVAAISVSGPTIRMSEDRILLIAPVLQRTALEISKRLGYRP